jgi:hypothetical protein
VGNLGKRLAEAARLGFTHAVVPAAHWGESVSAAADSIKLVPVETLSDALAYMARAASAIPAPRRVSTRTEGRRELRTELRAVPNRGS